MHTQNTVTAPLFQEGSAADRAALRALPEIMRAPCFEAFKVWDKSYPNEAMPFAQFMESKFDYVLGYSAAFFRHRTKLTDSFIPRPSPEEDPNIAYWLDDSNGNLEVPEEVGA